MRFGELDSKALTKIQTAALVAIIVVAAVAGGSIYLLFIGQEQSTETIRLGVLTDMTMPHGKHMWQSVVLAAEEINAMGGILGRQVEVFVEDREVGIDAEKVRLALTRLITYHKADFIIGQADGETGMMSQEIMAEHKKIFISIGGPTEALTQRVLDDYDKYKYFFRVVANDSASIQGMVQQLLFLRERTAFNKIGYLGVEISSVIGVMERLDDFLPANNFDLVYKGSCPPLATVDFTSYFAAAENAGVEVMVPLIPGEVAIPFVKEYYTRQSPMVIFSGVLNPIADSGAWEQTDGQCDYVSANSYAIVTGYPLTSWTLPVREAYVDRWGEIPMGSEAYDVLRFILLEAIERAGTTETDAVIAALEETSVETSSTENFAFTSSHDKMRDAGSTEALLLQWQNGTQVPVYPKELMEEAGATYMFPDWPGPWD